MSAKQNRDISIRQPELSPVKAMTLSYSIVSETGLQRSNNEDAVLFYEPEKPWIAQSMGILAAVSDGMGGYSRGEKASSMAIELLKDTYFNSLGSPEELLTKAAIEANNAIANEAIASGTRMGTTCTALVILKDQLCFMHIGDSRCYLFEQGSLRQITNDHTAANELAASGALRSSDQTMLYNPHALTKAMGIEPAITCRADVFSMSNHLMKGDRILLCTDGLFLHIPTDELEAVFQQKLPLKETTDKLVRTVMQRGARDNFSFILIQQE
jgi:protein phosphatase